MTEQKFDGQWMHGDANDILQVVVGQLDEARREIERLRTLLQAAAQRAYLDNIIDTGMKDLLIGGSNEYANEDEWIEGWLCELAGEEE